MFIAALFIIAKTWKTWKEPRCLLTVEWIKKIWYTHTHTHTHTHIYSAIKKSEIMSFSATWMALESVIMSKSVR